MFDLQGLHIVLKLGMLVIMVPLLWLFITNLISYIHESKQIPPSYERLKQADRKTILYGVFLVLFLIINIASFLKLSPQSDATRTSMRHSFDTEVYQTEEPFVTIRPNKYLPDHEQAQTRWDNQRNATD